METNSNDTLQIAGRVYHLNENHGFHTCYYRVINKVTGIEWQGIKRNNKVRGTHSCYCKYDGAKAVIISPVVEGFLTWANAPVGTKLIFTGYRSREALVAAIKAAHQ